MIEKNPSLGAELKLIIKESPCFIGVAKGQDPLRSKVNDVLLAAMADGTLDDLSKKWLGKSVGDLPLSD
jgi:polar amino acid transport system substrate-binding protein